MVWKPRVVVASIVEQDDRYLLVEEEISGRMMLNQPAGHLEYGESILDAVKRETLEETGYRFEPEAFLGATLAQNADPDRVYLRFAFCGKVIERIEGYQLDNDISAVHWLSEAEIRNHPHLIPRSEQVLHSIGLYQRGVHLSLDSVHNLDVERSN